MAAIQSLKAARRSLQASIDRSRSRSHSLSNALMPRIGPRPDALSCTFALRAAARLSAASQIHSQLLRRGLYADIILATTLVDAYAKSSAINLVEKVLGEIPQRDALGGRAHDALALFHRLPTINDVTAAVERLESEFQIELAEVEMPGLMSCRAKFGPSQPFKGARITGSLHMTIQTVILPEILITLGVEVRWCPCNIFSTQDHAVAAIARDSAVVFAWKGETLQEYWWCTERVFDWGPDIGPDLIVDDGGDDILLIHEEMKAEEEYEKTGKVSDPTSTDNVEFQLVLGLIQESLKVDPKRYQKMKERLVGVSEETTTRVKWLYQMQVSGTLLFPAINVNDSATKSKFDNLYECHHSLPNGLMRATNVMIAGKVVVVVGYRDINNGCDAALKQAGARVIVTESKKDPIKLLKLLDIFTTLNKLRLDFNRLFRGKACMEIQRSGESSLEVAEIWRLLVVIYTGLGQNKAALEENELARAILQESGLLVSMSLKDSACDAKIEQGCF